ncbi:hypothetical protein QTI33_12255 [Variovorax sp. J22P271]|uniref:hypothetical protein n=1 Tax=Variovorax davisae TaxID=3053515 RepID=UPI002574F652|nr:hypothetical protein [Variovorax sp. J22P271]MDM0032897.1 hypothetical protein [Variovorax sp. J22P271]
MRGPVAYVQVGDLVEMWFRRAPSDFATCEFCQTVNHQSDARCRTCGCPLPVRDEVDPAPEPAAVRDRAAPPSAAKSLTHVMRLALLPPLLLFAGFAGWYQTRLAGTAPQAAVAATVAAPAPAPAHAAAKPSRLAAGDLGLSEGEVAIVSRGAPSAAAADEEDEPAQATAAEGNTPARTRRVATTQSAAARVERNPLAACSSSSNFFARAICVNSRCADPRSAHLGQCREAIRQRQIDEARRNPSLMG